MSVHMYVRNLSSRPHQIHWTPAFLNIFGCRLLGTHEAIGYLPGYLGTADLHVNLLFAIQLGPAKVRTGMYVTIVELPHQEARSECVPEGSQIGDTN